MGWIIVGLCSDYMVCALDYALVMVGLGSKTFRTQFPVHRIGNLSSETHLGWGGLCFGYLQKFCPEWKFRRSRSHNFPSKQSLARPGKVKRLRLGWCGLSPRNPRLQMGSALTRLTYLLLVLFLDVVHEFQTTFKCFFMA